MGSFVAHGLTQAEAESEVVVHILAGSDTTATAIRSTMLHLVTNARAVAALRAEIDAAGLGEGIVSNARASTLPYV